MNQRRMAAILLGLSMFIGCEQKPADRTTGQVTSEDVQRDVGQAINTTVEFSEQVRDDYQKKLSAKLEEADGEIKKLRERGSDLKDQARENWEKTMADLEKKRDAARTRLEEVGHSSAEAWKEVQKGAESAWAELDKSFREAASKF